MSHPPRYMLSLYISLFPLQDAIPIEKEILEYVYLSSKMWNIPGVIGNLAIQAVLLVTDTHSPSSVRRANPCLQ